MKFQVRGKKVQISNQEGIINVVSMKAPDSVNISR